MSKTLDVMPSGVTEARDPTNSEVVSWGSDSEILFDEIDEWLNYKSSMPKSGEHGIHRIREPYVYNCIQIGSLLDLRLLMSISVTLTMEQDGEFYVGKSYSPH